MQVDVLVGTAKGAFILRADETRRDWTIEGPLFKGWKVTASARDGRGGFLAATASDVYGPSIHRSRDLAEWTSVEQGPRYAEGSGFELKQVWTLAPAPDADVVYAGVDQAGLFVSRDAGLSWQIVEALSGHPTRPKWYPGFGGMCAHRVLVDPKNLERLWVGISAVGVFRSDDGGLSWQVKNEGVPAVIPDEEHPDIGCCVHGLAADPDDADTIWRQDHKGMFRTRDGGDHWQRIEDGLPASFGFPLEIDPRTKALFSVPQEADEYRIPVGGRFAVYRSRDGGDSWEARTEGLPKENAWAGALRGAMAVDGLDPCGVYVGTTSGTMHVSADCGDTWQTLPHTLPRVLSVRAFAG